MFTSIENIVPGDVVEGRPDIGEYSTVLTVAKIVDWSGAVTGYVIKYTDNTQEQIFPHQRFYVKGHDSRVDKLLAIVHPHAQDYSTRHYHGD